MDNIGIHEFIWTNTNTEISGQGYYIGAELQYNSVLTFYLVIPSKNICEIIKSYLIPNTLFPNENLPKYPINENWFNYTSTPDKDRISVFPPNKFSSMEVHTRQFVIDAGAITKVKFLEITVPKVFEYNENLPKYPINENWFNYTSTPDKDRIIVFPPNKFSSMEVHTRQNENSIND